MVSLPIPFCVLTLELDVTSNSYGQISNKSIEQNIYWYLRRKKYTSLNIFFPSLETDQKFYCWKRRTKFSVTLNDAKYGYTFTFAYF